MNKRIISTTLPAFVLLAGLALTGCSTGGTVGKATAESAAPAAEAPAEVPAAPVNPAFGDTFTYEDGIAISVAAPEPYTPGEYAAGADQAANIVLTFTITNGSDVNLEPLTLPKVASAGVEGSMIIDVSDSGMAAFAPTTVILPGGTSTWRTAYSVADPANLIVQVAPTPFEHADAIFTNVVQ